MCRIERVRGWYQKEKAAKIEYMSNYLWKFLRDKENKVFFCLKFARVEFQSKKIKIWSLCLESEYFRW